MTVYDFSATTIEGRDQPLTEFAGKVLLIVNTASNCGFTSQYKQLQTLHDQYQDKGFAVLGFPCNQFGDQEPGDESEIQQFCEVRYGVNFPLYAKVDVNGEGAHPLFTHLKQRAPGLLGSKNIKWNFTKFLVDRHGEVIARYAPSTSPAAITDDVEKALAD